MTGASRTARVLLAMMPAVILPSFWFSMVVVPSGPFCTASARPVRSVSVGAWSPLAPPMMPFARLMMVCMLPPAVKATPFDAIDRVVPSVKGSILPLLSSVTPWPCMPRAVPLMVRPTPRLPAEVTVIVAFDVKVL